MKEVLGNAHELVKTLVEGKTHGPLQVPSEPPKNKSPDNKYKKSNKTESPEPELELTPEKNKEGG